MFFMRDFGCIIISASPNDNACWNFDTEVWKLYIGWDMGYQKSGEYVVWISSALGLANTP